MSLDCEGQYSENTHTGKGRTGKLHKEKCQDLPGSSNPELSGCEAPVLTTAPPSHSTKELLWHKVKTKEKYDYMLTGKYD